jgi:signal transduction histidine kinase
MYSSCSEGISGVSKTTHTALIEEHHVVQFYEDEGFLFNVVADFIDAGVRAGEPLLVIATHAHWRGFLARLALLDHDVDRLCESDQLSFLDARETLARFMLKNQPDRQRFHDVISAALNKSSLACNAARVRAYGEMVDLLWKDGKPDAAIQVEGLWNEIGTQQPLTLLCTYAMGNFQESVDSTFFNDVCRAHTHVFQNERYLGWQHSHGQKLEGSCLQQRARALETEIEHRKQAEYKLRESREDLRQLWAMLHSLREEEQKRISRELHDDLGQLLTAIKLELGCLATRLETPTRRSEVREKLADLKTLVSAAMTSVHTLAAGLRPRVLDDFGLVAAVEWLAREFRRTSGVRCTFAADREAYDLDPTTATAVFRIVQEALTNVARHAQAQEVVIKLSQEASRFTLTIVDDGSGLRPEAAAGPRMGLLGMRERVRLLRGVVAIASSPDKGVTITVNLPCR